MSSKNTIILGDSYSTFEDYVPEGYDLYYFKSGRPETDVIDVSQTWWHQVVSEANLNLILNDSWSGSPIGYTGYNNEDCSHSSSFIYRLKKMIEQNFFKDNRIDTVFVFGGTNDNWADAPIGTAKYDNWSEDDLYSVLPAISYFFKLLRDTLPSAEIYCIINTELKPEVFNGLKDISLSYGATPICLDSIDKNSGHPTIKGMQDIKNAVLTILNNEKKAE